MKKGKGWRNNSHGHSIAAKGIKSKDVLKYLEKQGEAYKKGITEKDVDPKELKIGIEVEMEHTNSHQIAKKIALDHLAEHKHYYSNLKKYEKTFDRSPEEGLLDNFFGGL